MHQAQSGGLTIDATNAENHCTIIAIAPAESDTNVIWVGTDDGNVQLTRDAGKTWTNLSAKMVGLPKGCWIPYIYTNPQNAGEAWVVANNYRNNDFTPYLFVTKDFGKTWTRMLTNSKVSGHCLSVLPLPGFEQTVFLGTDHGLWVSFNEGKDWRRYPGFPATPAQDLKYQKTEGDLVVGTFGRGIWILDDVKALGKLSKNGLSSNNLSIINATHGYLANYMQPAGVRFGADGTYEAENKPYGSYITYHCSGNKNSKTGKWEKTKITGKVYDASGKLIRTHKFSIDSAGIYRITWRMIADGFRFPSHRTPDADATLPEGMRVAPGKYKLVMSTDKGSDSTWVEVKETSQEQYDAQAEQVRRNMMDRLKASAERAHKAFEGLKEAEKTMEIVLKTRYSDDSASSRLKKLSGPLKDSITALKDLFMLREDFKGYEDVSVRLNDRLGAAAGSIGSARIPGGNAESALKTAEKETAIITNRVNAFFNKEWAAFKDAAEKEKPSLFKALGGY
jgi:hypothetical protein